MHRRILVQHIDAEAARQVLGVEGQARTIGVGGRRREGGVQAQRLGEGGLQPSRLIAEAQHEALGAQGRQAGGLVGGHGLGVAGKRLLVLPALCALAGFGGGQQALQLAHPAFHIGLHDHQIGGVRIEEAVLHQPPRRQRLETVGERRARRAVGQGLAEAAAVRPLDPYADHAADAVMGVDAQGHGQAQAAQHRRMLGNRRQPRMEIELGGDMRRIARRLDPVAGAERVDVAVEGRHRLVEEEARVLADQSAAKRADRRLLRRLHIGREVAVEVADRRLQRGRVIALDLRAGQVVDGMADHRGRGPEDGAPPVARRPGFVVAFGQRLGLAGGFDLCVVDENAEAGVLQGGGPVQEGREVTQVEARLGGD